jgi:hypothetical protein
MFLKPFAYICYAKHSYAAYSEPLNFVKNAQHTQILIDFLSGFIADPGHRGRDPTVVRGGHGVHIRHAGITWAELPNGLLWYRPSLVDRNLRIAWVEPKGASFPEPRVIMKSSWEENLSPESSPPPEAEILKILLKAKVRGLPQPYDLDNAIVGDDDYPVETCKLPEEPEVAFPASTTHDMGGYVSSYTTKRLASAVTEGHFGEPFLRQVKTRRQDSESFSVRRQLTRIIMSYCKPLRDAMRNAGPEALMRTIRDAMIVYYEAYKLPESGFIHGSKYLRIFCKRCANE